MGASLHEVAGSGSGQRLVGWPVWPRIQSMAGGRRICSYCPALGQDVSYCCCKKATCLVPAKDKIFSPCLLSNCFFLFPDS